MRISRALALAGIDSRRQCEIHVRNGAVSVNGEVVRDLGRQVDPENDAIAFRGRVLPFEKKIYFILYKPVGYTTTADDPHAKKTVYDLLPRTLVSKTHQPKESRRRVFPVGRLDKDSSGLLFFTNDGDLAHCLTHPRYEVGKWYEVRLDRAFRPEDGRKLTAGISLEEGPAKAEKIRPLSRRVLQLLIREGKKREIRRMFEALDYKVVQLCRFALGPLTLDNLLPGRGRFLTPSEITDLKRIIQKTL